MRVVLAAAQTPAQVAQRERVVRELVALLVLEALQAQLTQVEEAVAEATLLPLVPLVVQVELAL